MRQVTASDLRYRLVVIKDDSPACEPNVLNVGKEVAEVVGQMRRKYGQSEPKFQIEMADAVEKTIRQHIYEDEELGSVVVLCNLGILFESELHIDLAGMLKRISKNTLTVLLWPGEMDAQRLYFLDKKSNITINQSDINYIII